jgi:hypothetical protein
MNMAMALTLTGCFLDAFNGAGAGKDGERDGQQAAGDQCR